MTRHVWIHDGRKADAATLTATLSAARADKMRRLEQLRIDMQTEASDDADARALHKATKKRLREIDRELRKLDAHLRRVGAANRKASRELDRTILTYARSHVGGQVSDRDIQRFDKVFHLGKPSHQKGDGLSSFHCKFTSRGFGERRADRSRTYKRGEAVRHLRYIVRDSAREQGTGGLVSNISKDPDELAGFFNALEELEAHDRANANVYMSLVLSLPHELTPAMREQLLRETCDLLAEHELPFVGVLHAPDPRGDQRNFHAHVMFSLRPCSIEVSGRYAFTTDKSSDLNDETFIEPFRHKVADIMNAAMVRENHGRRFTALSDAERGLEPRSKRSGKSSPGEKHWQRRQADLVDMQREQADRLHRQSILERLQNSVEWIAAEPPRDRQALLAEYAAQIGAGLASKAAALQEGAARRSAIMQQLAADTHAAAVTQMRLLSERLQRAKPTDRRRTETSEIPAAAQPVPAPRDPERRRAIAAAARSHRQAASPPIVRTAKGFAIAPAFVSDYVSVDRFEAEPVIQRVHRRKWDATLAAVRKRIEQSGRSPFVGNEDPPKLQPDALDVELRYAYRAAYSSHDMQALLGDLRRDWQARDETQRREQRKIAQTKAETEAKLRARADQIIARAESIIEEGKWPGANDVTIVHLAVIARAVISGKFAMQSFGGDAHDVYCETEVLKNMAGSLAASPTGRAALVALGEMTAGQPIDYKALTVGWGLAPPRVARVTGIAETSSEPSEPDLSRGPGGRER